MLKLRQICYFKSNVGAYLLFFSFKIISVLTFFTASALKEEQFTKSENFIQITKKTSVDGNSLPNVFTGEGRELQKSTSLPHTYHECLEEQTGSSVLYVVTYFLQTVKLFLKSNLSGISINLNSICDGHSQNFKNQALNKFWLNKVFSIHKVYCREVQYSLLLQAKTKDLSQGCNVTILLGAIKYTK